MAKRTIGVAALVLWGVTAASAQTTLDGPYQVRAVPKLKKNDVIAITNAGASNADLCANVYAFEPGGQMLACCSCLVPLRTFVALSAGADVFENRKPIPKAAIFKALTSVPVGGQCNAAAPGALALGLVVAKGEAPFTPATLSAGELAGLTQRCGFLHATANTCPACRAMP